MVVLFDKKWSKKNRFSSAEILEELKKNYRKFDYSLVGSSRGFLRHILVPFRELRNYRRYLVVGGQSDFYRRDWIGFLPKKIRPALQKKNSIANYIIKSSAIGFLFRLAENFSPADSMIRAHIEKIKPDIVVVSPANMRHSSADLEYLKAAKALGIPTAVSVMSWDNLTVRGVIPVIPDLLLAWNKAQFEEAIEHHNIPKDLIRITGSPLFDDWFKKFDPSMSREDFARINNLRAGDPYVVYLGSSVNIAKDEVWLIEELRHAMDNSNYDRVHRTQLVIRPHPSNYHIYEHLEGDGIIIIPKKGTLPATSDARQLFYDSLYYSIGTVGINTSGMIDALINDKPCSAIMTEKYRQTQLEAVHFRQFLKEDCLEIAKAPEDFSEIVRSWLDGRDEKKNQRRAFVKNYIRPLGLDVPAGRAAADEIEKLAS